MTWWSFWWTSQAACRPGANLKFFNAEKVILKNSGAKFRGRKSICRGQLLLSLLLFTLRCEVGPRCEVAPRDEDGHQWRSWPQGMKLTPRGEDRLFNHPFLGQNLEYMLCIRSRSYGSYINTNSINIIIPGLNVKVFDWKYNRNMHKNAQKCKNLLKLQRDHKTYVPDSKFLSSVPLDFRFNVRNEESLKVRSKMFLNWDSCRWCPT
jgi:hypothetical protein